MHYVICAFLFRRYFSLLLLCFLSFSTDYPQFFCEVVEKSVGIVNNSLYTPILNASYVNFYHISSQNRKYFFIFLLTYLFTGGKILG